ncbi:MAG: aspartate kinase [Rhodothermales bacterium]|nr:aspartate kinase [Rhodothermales bacterium]
MLKFGGSSVGSVESLRSVVRIVCGEAERSRPVLVVSALSGVTDALECLAESLSGDAAASRTDEMSPAGRIAAIRDRHESMAHSVLSDDGLGAYLRELNRHIAALERDVASNRTDRTERIIARGELMSAPLVAALLSESCISARAVDSRDFVRTRGAAGGRTIVDDDSTRANTRAWFEAWPADIVPVVTGFIARDAEGRTTLLGRGGSDYSAALIAEGIGAAKLDRWTDVDGLHTADPRRFDGTRPFLYLLLEDASTWNEASRLGMHRHTFEPALRACFPVHVRSTRHPERDGTLIVPRALTGRIETDARAVLAHAEHRRASDRARGVER